jgi:hypothetical protein
MSAKTQDAVATFYLPARLSCLPCTHLAQPKPEFLDEVARNLLGPHFSVQCCFSSPNICLHRFHELGSLEYLPESIQTKEDRESNVSSEETCQFVRAPWRCGENFKAVEEEDQYKKDAGSPGEVRLPWALENQGVAINILSNESSAEACIRDAYRAPCEELGNRCEVLKPKKYLIGPSGYTHIRDQGDRSGDGDAVDRDTRFVALKKDLGCVPILCNAEEIARSSVQKCVTR